MIRTSILCGSKTDTENLKKGWNCRNRSAQISSLDRVKTDVAKKKYIKVYEYIINSNKRYWETNKHSQKKLGEVDCPEETV